MANPFRPAGNVTTAPEVTAADGFPLDPEDIEGAKGAGPVGELEDEEDPDGLDDEAFQHAINAGITSAENYIDDEVSPHREIAAAYYYAEPFGNEERGRSQAVSPEVRNSVLAHMPGLIRMFCGTERYVEFNENPGTPSEQADAQTKIVQHAIMKDNPGYQHIRDFLDDACRRKTGVFHWWWEEREIVTRSAFSGLNEDAFALLQMEAQDRTDIDELVYFEVVDVVATPDEMQEGGALVPPALQSGQDPAEQAVAELMGAAPQMMIYSGALVKRIIRKRVRFRCCPPEEVIFLPTTSSNPDEFELIGTRQDMTVGQLVALGYDEVEIREAIGGSGGATAISTLAMNTERLQREDKAGYERILNGSNFAEMDPASERVKYCEVWVLIDRDGDGIPERRKVCTVGGNNTVIYDELYDDDIVPFAIGTPYPEPHSPIGQSPADFSMDLQEIKSDFMRGTIDSLNESIRNRIAFQQGKVNIDDLMNSETGGLIRTTDVPANVIQDLAKQFVGANTLQIMNYLDEERNRRTGVNPASPTGFDPDSTQSTAREAVGSMIDASQERTEYIGRNFAELAFARLYRGVRNLLLRHQDHRRVIRFMGEAIIFDPRSWVSDLDVEVLVGTGRTSGTKKAMALEKVLLMQKEIIAQYGPANGFVSLEHISYTMAQLMRAMGFNTPYRFAAKMTPELEQQIIAKAEAAAAQPTPEQLLAQIQAQKIQLDTQAKMANIEMQRDRTILQDDQRRDAAEMKFATDSAKILGQYGQMVDQAAMRREMQDEAAANAMADRAVEDNTPQPAPEPAANA